MRKKARVSILLFCCASWQIARCDTNNIVEELLRGTGSVFAVRSIPPTERPAIVLALKSFIATNSYDVFRQKRSHLILLELNDVVTIEGALRKLRNGGSAEQHFESLWLQESKQASLISYLVPDLLREESPYPYHVEEHGYLPLSSVASEVIRSILQNSPDFNSSVRTWASALSQCYRDKLREEIRKWYQQNKSALERKDYSSVTPPPQ